MLVDGVGIEEECDANKRLVQEIGGEGRYPFEDREASTRFQHEECNSLLNEEAHDNRMPSQTLGFVLLDIKTDRPGNTTPVAGTKPESTLEDKKAEY
jgi:hypothetical protein